MYQIKKKAILEKKVLEKTYPRMSIIRLNKSNSEAPGNNGSPRNNSATMQPKDHISIAVVYLSKWLRVTSETIKNQEEIYTHTLYVCIFKVRLQIQSEINGSTKHKIGRLRSYLTLSLNLCLID